jgi:hydrogenase expression/formation protein HypE
MDDEKILLSHGSGGRRTRSLIEQVIVKIFDNPVLDRLEDSAVLTTGAAGTGEGRLVMTTDSYVVSPLFFPGGDIGKLSVCGTVNDLATAAADPVALSVGLIIEEGFPIHDLERILRSMKETAESIPVPLVTGDTKVVERGRGDGIYISTTGVGLSTTAAALSPVRIEPGDVVLVNGPIGSHEAAILCARGDFSFDAEVVSDCAPLHALMKCVMEAVPDVKCARDPTRGGVASVLTELVEHSGHGITIEEERLAVERSVQGVCDILGMDPIMMANEGKMIVVVSADRAERCLEAMRSVPEGRESAIIGEVHSGRPRLTMKTLYGTRRVITMPMGNQLPRIC